MLSEDEVYHLQARIDDFQQCMEDVEERFMAIKSQKPTAISAEGEEKKVGEDKDMKSEDKPKESDAPKQAQSALLNVLMSSEQVKEPAGDGKEEGEKKQEKQLPDAA